MMRKSVIGIEDKRSWWKGDFGVTDIIGLAMDKAYRDFQRTLHGFSINTNRGVIIERAKTTLRNSVNAILSAEISSQGEFNALHEKACDDLILSFSGQPFTVGKAQKWINMTFKYLHLLDYPGVEKVYEYCHVPIDSYMLGITNYRKIKAWSKLDDYCEYLKFQNWFREKYPNDIPLDKEFYLWLEAARKQKR